MSNIKDVVDREDESEDSPMVVTVIRESDGARVVDVPEWRPEGSRFYTWHDVFWWTEGNMGCDCNRHLTFERAHGREPADEELVCGGVLLGTPYPG